MSEWTRPAQPVRCVVELDKPLAVHRERGVLAQGDANANAIVAEVYSTAGKPYDLSGCTMQLIFVRPDNNALPAINAEISGNTATATLPDGAYTMSGIYSLRMQLRKNGAERTIVWIIGEVKGTDVDGIADPEHVISIGDIMASAKEAQTAASNANTAAERANTGAERVEQLQIDASGLAGDSNKLGGKPPEYYMQVEDLLDNGDLAIAQAGRPLWDAINNKYTSGLHGSMPYAGDRWEFDGGVATEVAGGVKLSRRAGSAYSYLTQKIPTVKKNAGSPYTFAVYFTDGSIGVVHGDFQTVKYMTVSDNSGNACILGIEQNNVVVSVGETPVTVKRFRLLPGAYTAETLPPFVPPDPLTELEKCQYYFRRIKGGVYATFGVGAIRFHNRADILIPLGNMRLDNVSFIAHGSLLLTTEGYSVPVTSIQCDITGNSDMGIVVNAMTGDSQLVDYIGYAILLQSDNNSETYIDVSADL